MSVSERWLNESVSARRVLPFKFNRQLMLVDCRLAVYWVSKRTLIVSDLHLEKGSYLSQFANPIPNYDSLSTLLRLSSLIDDYQPDSVIALGDSIHDIHAFSRMTKTNQYRLQGLVKRVSQWYWVLGNHDPELPDFLGKEQHQLLEIDNMLFCHEPVDRNLPQIFGHFHPKATHKSGKLKVTGPCLLYSDTRLIMPAFGQYTGGLHIDDPVFDSVLPFCAPSVKRHNKKQGFVIKDNTIVPFTKTHHFK